MQNQHLFSKEVISTTYETLKNRVLKNVHGSHIHIPRLYNHDGRYTINGLTLVFYAYHLGDIKHKRELMDFLHEFECRSTDPQPRHLGMQYGFNFLVKGCYHPKYKRHMQNGEFSLLDLDKVHPNVHQKHRKKDIAFTPATFLELKTRYKHKCVCCGSIEGQPHSKNMLYITKLEMGHMDPRLPLAYDNCIPMCNMCNMVYKNHAVFNANGFIVKWLSDIEPSSSVVDKFYDASEDSFGVTYNSVDVDTTTESCTSYAQSKMSNNELTSTSRICNNIPKSSHFETIKPRCTLSQSSSIPTLHEFNEFNVMKLRNGKIINRCYTPKKCGAFRAILIK